MKTPLSVQKELKAMKNGARKSVFNVRLISDAKANKAVLKNYNIEYNGVSPFQGSGRNDVRETMPKEKYAVDEIYRGEWADDKRHGYGELVFSRKSSSGENDLFLYKGWFKDGNLEGKGDLFQLHPHNKMPIKLYSGDFVNSDFDGEGYLSSDYKASNFSLVGEYHGQMSKGMKHGKGHFLFSNGEKYNGDFFCNKIQGHGKHEYLNHNLYEGDFFDGRRNGFGTTFFWDAASGKFGTVFSGKYKADQPVNGQTMSYEAYIATNAPRNKEESSMDNIISNFPKLQLRNPESILETDPKVLDNNDNMLDAIKGEGACI